jgi:DNA-binding NtrC family response regulator/tetratricopeptide (TPR) repeat protein
MDAHETRADSTLPIHPTMRGRESAVVPFGVSGFSQALALGDMQVLADDLPSAILSYQKALAILGNDPTLMRRRAEASFRIADCYRRRGEFHESLVVLSRIREEVDPQVETELNAKILGRTGMVQQSLGEYAVARINCSEAYAILRGGSDNEEIGLLELNLGTIAYRLGEIDHAREYYESALFTFRRIDHREGIARALNNLGLLLRQTPRWKEALDYFQRALEVSEESGNSPRIASHSLNMGVLLTKRCAWTRGLQVLSRALLIFRENDNSTGIARSHLALGNLKRRLGQEKIAASHYQQALDLASRHGYRREEVLAYEFIGEMALRNGRFEEARSALTEALRKAEEVAPEGDLVCEVRRRFADLELLRGDTTAASRWAIEGAWIAARIGDRCELGSCLRILGLAAWEGGRPEVALRHLCRSVEILSETPDLLEETISRIRLAATLNEAANRRPEVHVPARAGRPKPSAIEILEPVWDRLIDLDLTWLVFDYTDVFARSLVNQGDLEGALRVLDRALEVLEKQERTEERGRLMDLRIQLAENQAECVLGTTEEFRILQDFTPAGGSDMGSGGLNGLLEQMANHLQIAHAIVAIGPSFKEVKPEASLGVSRPEAMLRGLDPILQAFSLGRMVWLSGNGARDIKLGEAKDRWRQNGPLVALRLRPGEDLWGVLAAERAAGSEAFGTRDLRLLSLFGSLISVSIEARQHARMELVEDEMGRGDPERDPFAKFQTVDAVLKQTLSLLRRVADSDANILITGETGTGKGLLAEGIHRASRRRDRALIQINCAALPEQLLESELFGHVQGAFTGAVRNKKGLIEEADGGTLFLDEVDRCHRNVQAKLLHVLDRREFRAVGDVRSRTVDVRIICATNRDLAAAIAEGDFLEDLYYRLNDFQFSIPPLRERPDDIPTLVRHFLQRFTKEMERKPAGISRETLRRLIDHEWRGNVRELEKCMRRLVVLSEDGEWIGADLLPPEFQTAEIARQGHKTLRDAVRRLEADLIKKTLDETKGNKSETSRRLRLSYPALLQKIRLYKLEPGLKGKRPRSLT